MPVRDEPAAGERGPQPLVAPGGRAGVVHEPDPQVLGLDDAPLGEELLQRPLVHVAVHRLDRRKRTELLEHGCRGQVADVEHERRLAEELDAPGRQRP